VAGLYLLTVSSFDMMATVLSFGLKVNTSISCLQIAGSLYSQGMTNRLKMGLNGIFVFGMESNSISRTRARPAKLGIF
jgi:hypothetical protein